MTLEEVDEALAVGGGVDARDLGPVVGEGLEESLSVFPRVVLLSRDRSRDGMNSRGMTGKIRQYSAVRYAKQASTGNNGSSLVWD